MIDDDLRQPFAPPEALALIDREGFREAVESHLMVGRQLRQMWADYLADHRGSEHHDERERTRARVGEALDENGRRIVLLHVVNDAVYGREVKP